MRTDFTWLYKVFRFRVPKEENGLMVMKSKKDWMEKYIQ